MYKFLFALLGCLTVIETVAQPDRWQQRVVYDIDATLDVVTNKLAGFEKLHYTNNSPDTLTRLFFHVYWNAFQPNSSMDLRSRDAGNLILGKDKDGNDIRDWDPRIGNRIAGLQPNETGSQKILSLKINGIIQQLRLHETIVEVVLDKPILPKSKTNIELSFEAQVPIQIRRSGRDNADGIRYSMSQWYPKLAEYDYEGWHATPYIAKEFYGVWGDYNVNITIDKTYTLAGTGTLQNPGQFGSGYSSLPRASTSSNTLTWKFAARNVHDFAWAADPNFTVLKKQIKNGPLLYLVFKNYDSLKAGWQQLADSIEASYPIVAKTFGPYPYKNYSFIQAGDRGTEYPMASFIKYPGIGLALHEFMHSWYQLMLGTNETLHAWMDEGFTSYATERVLAEMRHQKGFAFDKSYNSYVQLVKLGLEEPLATPADYLTTNYAYNAVDPKGSIFLNQLGYIVGNNVRDSILLSYYRQWKFRHPNPNDFVRVAEKSSNIQLGWYKNFWINTTKTIDYAIDSLWQQDAVTRVRLRRIGDMPMPLDVQLLFKDGTKENHYIPLNLMYGSKQAEDTITRKVYTEWLWSHRLFTIETTRKLFDISSVQIDPSLRMADIDRRNNLLLIKW